MAKRGYNWDEDVELDEHTECKLNIIEEYFREYLLERCKNPIARRFRLAIVDGFAGGGVYKGGRPGSPVIFAKTLLDTVREINEQRIAKGMPTLTVYCLIMLNDENRSAIEKLQENISPYIAMSKEKTSNVKLEIEISCEKFRTRVDHFVSMVKSHRFRSVIYNLDQYGHSAVDHSTITKLIQSASSVEVFLTYLIRPLLTYLSKTDAKLFNSQLRYLDLTVDSFDIPNNMISKKEWMGIIESTIFDHFRTCAPYVTPFSIHNPKGWRYWFMHFSKSYRARQVYNDVLHKNSSKQAHFGRAGLDMLSYNPNDKRAAQYLFDDEARGKSRDELTEDIAKKIRDGGDTAKMNDFYTEIYNETPAHSNDIHTAILGNPDLEIVTPSGNARRKISGISLQDTIRFIQPPMFKIFYPEKK